MGNVMDASHWFLLICLALNIFGCGFTWLVQAANYPLFAMVASADFVAYHKAHTRWVMPVVIIPAFIANGASILFIFGRPDSVPTWAALLNGALGLLILVVTVAIEIPRHLRLDKDGKSDTLIRSLVMNNWIRTSAFTAQAILMLWLITVAFVPV